MSICQCICQGFVKMTCPFVSVSVGYKILTFEAIAIETYLWYEHHTNETVN